MKWQKASLSHALPSCGGTAYPRVPIRADPLMLKDYIKKFPIELYVHCHVPSTTRRLKKVSQSGLHDGQLNTHSSSTLPHTASIIGHGKIKPKARLLLSVEPAHIFRGDIVIRMTLPSWTSFTNPRSSVWQD